MNIFENVRMAFIPAYTTRDVRNYGYFKANSLYKYLFTPEDKILVETGAIKLFPLSMCNFYTTNDVVFSDKKYKANEEIDVNIFDENTLKILIKTNVIKCELKENFKYLDEENIIKQVKLYDCVGKNFKEISEILSIDFSTIKEKFELKQGGAKKKVTEENIPQIKELLALQEV